ncbi:hypothetical protein BRC80_01425 [Halobacteriales archaeon QH_9_66_26]|nr:MAG: hypothetical protein BRC80_01425 [Halobacteriales archaeon QH_9_66_26]
MSSDRFGGSTDSAGRNAALGWLVVVLLAGLTVRLSLAGSYRWSFLTALSIALVVLPAAASSNPSAMPPWELLVLATIPVVDAAVLDETTVSSDAVYLAVAAVALIVAVAVHTFTPLRMNRPFAVALVVIATLAVDATWNVALWVADTTLGTTYLVGGRSQDAANRAVMIDFLYATVAGLLAWLVTAAQETVSRLLIIWLVTASIGILHLPHSIAGNVEVLFGVFVSPQVSILDYLVFLAMATAGNAVGGCVFVGVLKYGHVVRGGD